jgi:hypothetical protein
MSPSQFQFEPGVLADRPLARSSGSIGSITGAGADAATESLLLGLRLRGWLAASEKNLLDQLGAPECQTFLIQDNTYLHPEEPELFPLDLIRTAKPEGDDALFRHRYRPENNQYTSDFTIHSAFITRAQPSPIVLGLFDTTSTLHENEHKVFFAELAARFRKAALSAEVMYQQLKKRLSEHDPLILINRCSGRIIHVNRSVTELLKCEERELVDLEFGTFKQEFSEVLAASKMDLKNLSIGENRFTLISLNRTETRVSAPQPADKDLLIHKMRNKISGITTASSHLRMVLGNSGLSEEAELADMILGEAGDLERLLSRLLQPGTMAPKTDVEPSV